MRRGLFGPFMACPDYNADPPCKTFRKLSSKQQQKPPEPTGEDCPVCGSLLALARGCVRRICFVFGIPEVQIREAEPDRGDEVPEMRRGRCGRAASTSGQCLLGMYELSQVRLYFEFEARAEEVPEVRQSIPRREDAQVGRVSGMPEQEEDRGRRGQVGKARERRLQPRRRKRTRWPAPIRSGSAMRRLRQRLRHMGRWWRRRTRDELQPA